MKLPYNWSKQLKGERVHLVGTKQKFTWDTAACDQSLLIAINLWLSFAQMIPSHRIGYTLYDRRNWPVLIPGDGWSAPLHSTAYVTTLIPESTLLPVHFCNIQDCAVKVSGPHDLRHTLHGVIRVLYTWSWNKSGVQFEYPIHRVFHFRTSRWRISLSRQRWARCYTT